MNTPDNSTIGSLLKNYIESREKSFSYGKKRMDAEKEYNKLLTTCNGGTRHYRLDEADTIYRAYLNMISYGEEADIARNHFIEMEQKLKEIGEILFEASITAEIPVHSPDGNSHSARTITVTFNNGQVIVS